MVVCINKDTVYPSVDDVIHTWKSKMCYFWLNTNVSDKYFLAIRVTVQFF